MTMLELIYGATPSENIPKRLKAPPENKFRKSITPPPVLNKLAIAARSTPGLGIYDPSLKINNINIVKNIHVKIIANGELSKELKIKAGAFSAEAIKKIESAGGTQEVI